MREDGNAGKGNNMKVLWVCNILPPVIGRYLGKEGSVKEGWISGILMRLAKEKENVELAICYPVSDTSQERKFEVFIGNDKKILCYGFAEDTVHPEAYGGTSLEKRMREILEDYQPRILHVFGTEYGHSLAAVKAFGDPAHTLVGIQGSNQRMCERIYGRFTA